MKNNDIKPPQITPINPKGIASKTIVGCVTEPNNKVITRYIAIIPPIKANKSDLTDSFDFSASPP